MSDSLQTQKSDIEIDIKIIKRLKTLATADTTGLIETIKLAIQLATFLYATIQEISLKKKLSEIESLIYEEQRKLNNQSEVNTNEGIG